MVIIMQERSEYVDKLRVVAAFSVVLIHVIYQSVLYCDGGGM